MSDTEPKPRAARTLTGSAVRLSLWVAVLMIGGAALALANGWRPWRDPSPQPQPRIVEKPKQDPLAVSARSAASSVVAIEALGAGNAKSIGAGFVFDDKGLIVTSFHVVASATEAQARLADGRVFAIAGYAAADREHDLAILRLASPPDDLAPLNLSDKTQAAAQVAALGHPRGNDFSLTAGRISRLASTRDLPTDARRFLRQLTGGEADAQWLVHTATLAEGNSGGPLVDAEGRVAGVNTWINRETRTNYAISAKHLAKLAEAVSQDTIPLAKLARPEAQAAAIVARLNGGRIEELYAAAEKMHWLPQTDDDYRALQELALALSASHLPQTFAGDAFDQQRAHELDLAATQVEAKLAGKPSFASPERITIVNDHAAQVLRRPHAGIFCFAEVVRVFEGDRGQRGMLLKLAGGDEPLFISLDGQLLTPSPGEVYLLCGVHLGEVVRYGENPLKLTSAPVIVSRTVIKMALAGE